MTSTKQRRSLPVIETPGLVSSETEDSHKTEAESTLYHLSALYDSLCILDGKLRKLGDLAQKKLMEQNNLKIPRHKNEAGYKNPVDLA